MAATAMFQLIFPEVCWSNIIVTTRGSQAARSPLRAATRYTKGIW